MKTTSPLVALSNLPPGTAIGPYQLDRLLSVSSFGIVYRATRDGQAVQLKFPLVGLAAPVRDVGYLLEAKISREVASLMSLHHRGLAGVEGFGRWPDPLTGALYVVSDLVEGTRLLAWLHRNRPSVLEVVAVFRHLALALHQLHRAGLLGL